MEPSPEGDSRPAAAQRHRWVPFALVMGLWLLPAAGRRPGPLARLWRELQVLRLGDDAARRLGLDPARPHLRALMWALRQAGPRHGGGGLARGWLPAGVAPVAVGVLPLSGRG